MILANLLFLFRKIKEACGVDLDLVHPPNMAHSLLYSTNHANTDAKKRSEKVHYLLDKPVSPCYNKNMTIKKHPQ